MPKFTGVYRSTNGSWYCKATLGRDPVTGKRVQITKRGFITAGRRARPAFDRVQLSFPASIQPHGFYLNEQ